MSVITVLCPAKPEAEAELGVMAGRSPIREGAVLMLIHNGKSHAKIVLGLVADEVRRLVPEISHVEVFSKPSAGRPVSDDEARTLAERSTLVRTVPADYRR